MLKLVTFPGLAAIIVSFLLGFLIKDIAISKAQNDAITQTTDEVFELIKNTESARLNLSDLEAFKRTHLVFCHTSWFGT